MLKQSTLLKTAVTATLTLALLVAAAPQGSASPLTHKNLQATPRVASVVKQQALRPLQARAQRTKPAASKALPQRTTRSKAIRSQQTARPRIHTAAVMARLPKHEQAAMSKLLSSRRVRSSTEARRAVVAYMVLKGLEDGSSLPLTAAEMADMTSSQRWSARRMGNFALVLREAVRIAQSEKIGAKAAFNKALKKFGVYKKYYSGVCGA